MSTQVDPAVTQAAATQTTPNGAPSDWRATLPEELRSEKSLEKYKGVSDLAKGYVEASKLMGNAIRVPKDDSKPEEWDSYWTKIGRPDSPDKYEFKYGDLPEGMKVDAGLEAAVKGLAHKNGLLPRQAQGMVEGWNAVVFAEMAKNNAAMQEGVVALKKEWGPQFDTNVDLGRQSVGKLGGQKFKDFLNTPTPPGMILADHPLMLEIFAKLGAAGAEDRMVIGDSSTSDESSRDAIQLKINEILNDPKNPHNDPKAPFEVRQAASRQVSDLFKKLYPPSGE